MFLLRNNNLRSNNLTLTIVNRYFSTATPKSKQVKSEAITTPRNTTTPKTENLNNNNNKTTTISGISTNKITKSSNRSSIYDILRRKRDRAGLVNIEAEEDPDRETVIFPRERQGLDYELNWALNGYSITPHYQAYRNTRIQTLLQHSKGTTNSNNVLKVQQPTIISTTSSDNYYLDENVSKLNKGSSVLSVLQYKSILSHVKGYISDSKNIYVHDAAIGSDRTSECLIRAVTNDAFSSLYLNHILPSTNQSNLPVREFKHSLTLYLTPSLSTSPEKLSKFGLKSSQFNILDTKRGIAVISGQHNTENIQSVLNSLYSSALFKSQPDSISLSAEIVQSTKQSDKTLLVFNGSLANRKSDSIKVVSQGSVWNSLGLSRLYDALTFDNESAAQNPYDLVESFENSKKQTSIVPIKVTNNLYQSPSSIVFIIRDNQGVLPPFSELSADQAEKYFVSGFIGDNQFKPFFNSDQITISNKLKSETFKKLIQENNTNVYIINPVSLKDADVDQLLSSIASGKVNKSTKSDVYSSLSPIGKQQGEIKQEVIKAFENTLQSNVDKLLLL